MRGPLGAIIGRHASAAAEAGGGGDDDGATGVIRHDRKCRDLPFLAIFAAFWVAMIVNSSFGFNQGSPLRSLSIPTFFAFSSLSAAVGAA
jgi:choline transporter-like protein 2/4/5